MTPDEIIRLRQELPCTMPFDYYTDRESAWLLQALLPEAAPVRALRQGRLAKLLDRPLVKPLTSAGDGMIRRADLQVLAQADGTVRYDSLNSATLTALERAFDLPWLDFELSFSV